MNGMSLDSTKILTEKLSLARELATLKPELEHLRSQAPYQQAVLAEKLALQRQVSTMEVELETEKRAIKRLSEKNKNKDKELELQQKLDDLQKELAKEKREKEKIRKDAEKEASIRVAGKGSSDHEGHAALQQKLEALQKVLDDERREREKTRDQMQQELDDSETRSTLLEGKVDHLRTKMRAVKEQLKECQAELEEVRATVPRGPSTVRKGENLAKSVRKRPATEMSTDVTIGTPDGGAVRGKKRGRIDQTSRPGEKSNFSITPYLNRTVSKMKLSLAQDNSEDGVEITNDTASGSFDDSQQQDDSGLLFDENSPSARQRFKPKKPISEEQSPVKILFSDASSGSMNKNRDLRHSKSISSLKMVAEEDSIENEDPDLATTTTSIEKEVVTTSKVPVKDADEGGGPKKMKRKLLSAGRTIFDEIDASATKRPTKVSLGQPRSAGKGLGAGGVFGTFSPLKRHKKVSGASFLG